LILSQVDYNLVPIIALICNVIVVSGNCLRYHKNDLIPWSFTLPVILVSIPFALIGGNTLIDEALFIKILGWTLLFSGLMMFYRHQEITSISPKLNSSIGKFISIIVAAILGFLAGLVGIGGGIFFAPILHITQVLPTRKIAAFASIFILVNSIAGLIGQYNKYDNLDILWLDNQYIWLLLVVFIGGQLGSYISIKTIKPIILRRLTAGLVIYVGCRLLLI
tara:strand:- start:10550 stop:11212 length:663 start_codon:yes stop_codon:yes gene_type:complete